MNTSKLAIESAAQHEYDAIKGRVVLIRNAKVGDGNDHDDRTFNPPIRVRVLETNDDMIVGQWDAYASNGEVLDPIYDAEPIDPNDLPAGEHICWIYGVSRHLTGQTEPGSIVAIETTEPYPLPPDEELYADPFSGPDSDFGK
jgi:hypothetical protein